MHKFLTTILLIGLVFAPQNAWAASENYQISAKGLSLNINSRDLASAQVRSGSSTRGAALAILKSGNYLLGGGRNGNQLFLFDTKRENLINLGTAYSQRATQDARFAITDIEPFVEQGSSLSVLISYPKLQNPSKCVRVHVDLIEIDLSKRTLKNKSNWFISNPCVPISAVQHASGKLQKIDSVSAYLTVGDLGFTKVNNRSLRGDLTSVFKISENRKEKISTGHRNAQGILLYRNKFLLTSEHGPRGGDELNLIKPNTDYGWPFVTLGTEYSAGDYVIPSKINSHQGYQKPLMYWVPSIAPTDLVELPQKSNWKRWSGQLLMGTLREESLIRINLDKNLRPVSQERIKLNERIRGLEISPNGIVVATTDSGKLLEISPK